MEWLRAIFHIASVDHAKSTTLRPLQGTLIIIALTLLAEFRFNAPQWSVIVTVILLVLMSISFLIAYFYFMIKNPECLRTEKYSLQRLAIERGLGDNISGVTVLPDSSSSVRSLGVQTDIK